MTKRETPPDRRSPQPECAAGGGVTGNRRSANHGKPWDCKAMGAKVRQILRTKQSLGVPSHASPAAAAMANLLESKNRLREASGASATAIGYDHRLRQCGSFGQKCTDQRPRRNDWPGPVQRGGGSEGGTGVAGIDSRRQPVVLWVPSTNMDTRADKAAITAALKELEDAISAKNGKLVIWQYRSTLKICLCCPCRQACGANEKGQRLLTTHIWQEHLDLAEQLRKTQRGKEIYSLRKETIERVFADAKEKHGLRDTHHHGLARVTSWVRLKFAAMNLKSLLFGSLIPSTFPVFSFVSSPPASNFSFLLA